MDAGRNTAESSLGVEGLAVSMRSRRNRYPGQPFVRFILRLFREKPLAGFGLTIVVVLLLAAAFADIIAPSPWDEPDYSHVLEGPSWSHIMGTDYLGRDMYSRILYGARISLYVGIGAVFISSLITLSLGLPSGWFGGKVDTILQRGIVDVWIALPGLMILLTLVALLGTGLTQMIFILALGGFGSSRIIRGAVLGLKEQPYVTAAKAIGASTSRIMLRCILPNLMGPLLILMTLKFGGVILAESTLGFLGFGIPPPFPTWGRMLSSGSMTYAYEAPWLMLWPGLALTSVVFGFNVLGDGLRDLLDPRMRGGTGKKKR
jgi:peptide/nickel transport system permease protein